MVTPIALTRATNATCSILSARNTGLKQVPCHFIPLNTDGDTIEDLELQDNQAKLEREVSQWLRARIKQIEEERAEHATA